ncbi:MAG: Holliday junction resolvase RuvX [Sphingomonadales bacterium]
MICDLINILDTLKKKQRLMGLDIGTKTIGLALSDFTLTIASPMETIIRKKFTPDIEKILGYMKEHNAGGFVMGLPINMDGSEGPKCQSIRQFAKNLEKLTPLAISFWDERWSTKAVTRTLIEADTSRTRRKEVIDKMAASYILQGALDRLKRQS